MSEELRSDSFSNKRNSSKTPTIFHPQPKTMMAVKSQIEILSDSSESYSESIIVSQPVKLQSKSNSKRTSGDSLIFSQISDKTQLTGKKVSPRISQESEQWISARVSGSSKNENSASVKSERI
jgi:hypothetical protein